MAATAIHRLALDPMGKCSNAFFSETTNMNTKQRNGLLTTLLIVILLKRLFYNTRFILLVIFMPLNKLAQHGNDESLTTAQS
jgi:hypothetical protein